jgi:hypothetical protein
MLRNNGSVPQGISQSIPASGLQQYCLSVWAGGLGQKFRLRIDSGGVITERAFTGTNRYERYTVAAKPDSAADTVTFSFLVAPDNAVCLTAMQAEAQPAPGGYRRTNSRCGVYLNARFAEDELAWMQQAPNHNAAEIRIESRPN